MPPRPGCEPARRDIAADINARIIEHLERGVLPWKQPWSGAGDGGAAGLPLRSNGAPYRGVNIVLLWMAAAARGFRASRWYSFRQAVALGAHVRKGETGERVVYYGRIPRTRTDTRGETVEDAVRFLRAYVVFNADQIEGLAPDDGETPSTVETPASLADHEAWFSTLEIARILHPDRAFYSPARDVIAMPPLAAFDSPDLYAQTLNHECVHAAGASHRAGRDFSGRYGPDAYAVEEICAELGAAYLGAHLGLPPGHIHDHSAYIGHWIAALKNDRRAFLEAAAKAQAAVDWLLAKSGRACIAPPDAEGETLVVSP
ncbi:MAG: DUF1738 domain-containing protein [Hyphomonadaceae bacterium]|nr:DUF1738 domain-containing protein [Hyphomonadaceae bacterium]